jgi:enediyne biosynthesis protein E4
VVAVPSNNSYQAGMGVACGDLDGDAQIDLVVTNFEGESTTFYQNLGRGMFADRTAAIGLAAPSRSLLGFGVALLDVNNDGRIDLISANGHVNDFRPNLLYSMPMLLLVGGEAGRLTDVTAQAGPTLGRLRVGRGLASGDLDNDGRIDALVVSQDEPVAYLHNQTEGGHYLVLRLRGVTSNRDAVGAKVTIVAGERRQVAERFGGGSYLSAGDARLRFGLGQARRAQRVEVRWPSGQVDRHRDLAADTGYLLIEGDSEARPLKGWKHLPKTLHTTSTFAN